MAARRTLIIDGVGIADWDTGIVSPLVRLRQSAEAWGSLLTEPSCPALAGLARRGMCLLREKPRSFERFVFAFECRLAAGR